MAVLMSYLYRDAGNYKNHGEVVFPGETTPELEERLQAALEDGENFIAAQIGVPEVFLYGRNRYAVEPDSDHCWHELGGITKTDEEPTDPRPFAEFVACVEAASREGWKDFDPATELSGAP